MVCILFRRKFKNSLKKCHGEICAEGGGERGEGRGRRGEGGGGGAPRATPEDPSLGAIINIHWV